MNENKKKRKKLLAIILAVIIGIAAVLGIAYAVRATTTDSVVGVVPVSSINYGGYDEIGSMEGIVTTDVSQDVYLSGTETVKEVLVTEGEAVSEGDLLMTYDTTQTSLSLEIEKLQREQIQLSIDVANRNLEKLNKTKPVSENSGYEGGGEYYYEDPGTGTSDDDDDDDDDDDEPTMPDNPLAPAEDFADVKPLTILDGSAKAYNASTDGAGSIDNPLHFLVKDGTQITADFARMMKEQGKYFMIEIREGDSPAGELKAAWVENGALIADVADDWSATVSLSSLFPTVSGSTESESESESTSTPSESESTSTSTSTSDPTSTSTSTSTSDPASTSTSAAESTSSTSSAAESASSTAESTSSDSTSTSTDSGAEHTASSSEGSDASSSDTSGSESAASSTLSGLIFPHIKLAGSNMFSMLGGVVVMAADDLGESTYTSGTGLLTGDLYYTKEELAEAKREQQETLRDLKLDLQEADLKIYAGERAMADGEVRAKMDGVVKTAGDPENPPTDGSAFLSVTGTAGQYIRSAVTELMLDEVSEGDTVNVTSWMSGMTCEAVIKDISPYPDESGMFYSNTDSASLYPVILYVEEGGDTFENGEWLQVSYRGANIYGDVEGLFLWQPFVRDENGKKYVWKRGEDGLLTRVYVKTGPLSNSCYEILEGLDESDYVAFPYGKGLKEGAKTRETDVSELYNE